MQLRAILTAPLLMAATALPAQDFVWIAGSGAADQAASHGTQGTSAPTNTPGKRRRGVGWTSDDGRIWLFGGERDNSSNLGNDLWRYDPTTEEWTWMKGSSTLNSTGSRGALGSALSTNTPGARRYTTSFLGDDGRLWLFGGENSASSMYSDIWSYDPATNMWVWEAGSSSVNQFGDYTLPGVSPGARVRAASGRDSTGRLIMFGGTGRGAASTGDLNDLWRFDPATDTWDLLFGTGTVNSTGSFGTVGTPGGNPGGRSGGALWVDSSDRIYIFGGTGRASTSTSGLLNDMWRFDPGTTQWTWLGGDDTINGTATYGTLRVPAASNWPGARRTPTWDVDSQGHFMLFGGFGYSTSVTGGLADFWRYDPNTNIWTWTALVLFQNQVGILGTKGVTSPCNRVEAKSDAFTFASAPDRDFHIYGSYFGSDGEDTIWQFRLPNMTADTLELADQDGLNSPDPGFTNDPTIDVTLTSSGETPTYARLSQNSCLTDDTITPLPASLTFTLTGADGLKTVYARVGDDDAESYSISTTITLDTTPPVVSVDPLSTETVSPELTGTITEVNLRSISVEIDGNTYPATESAGTWSIAAGTITPDLAVGDYDVTVTATDQAGNVTIETATDAVTITEPTPVRDWLLLN